MAVACSVELPGRMMCGLHIYAQLTKSHISDKTGSVIIVLCRPNIKCGMHRRKGGHVEFVCIKFKVGYLLLLL